MDIDELVESVDIVEYISQYVDLEQRGTEYWGLSPFTGEKTPSFSIRRETGKFYDFSSGLGGGILTFIKSYHHLTSTEAIEELKRYVGYNGELATPSEKYASTLVCKKFIRPKTNDKTSTAKVLQDNYMDRYENNTLMLQAWRNEGISDEALRFFQVRYDRFSDRLVYPIRNLEGQIINVGGRTLDPQWKEKDLRKYCYFFPWGTISTIYGVSENKEQILSKKEVILFEGCKSVLLAYTWGIRNCGAILTSHLSQTQMKILAKLGCRVVFALDKEIDVRKDHNIQKLKQYVNVEYIWDRNGLLDEKDAPVDKGKEVFETLYKERVRLR